MRNKKTYFPPVMLVALAALLIVAAAGCSRGTPPEQVASDQPAEATPETPPAEPTPQEGDKQPAPIPQQQSPPSRAPSTPSQPSSSAPPPAPAEPAFEMVKVAVGKNIPITMETALSSKTSTVGQPIEATVATDIGTKHHPETVIPAGSKVRGTVVDVQKAKQLSGGALLAMKFETLTLPGGDSYPITATLAEAGESTKKRTAKGAGGGALGGAILGTIIGKDAKGALIGAAAGAAIGTGIVAGMDNKDVEIPSGAELIIELNQPIEVKVANRRTS